MNAGARDVPDDQGQNPSNDVMCAVAVGSVIGLFAAAQIDRAGLVGRESERCDRGGLVRAVAERLAFGATAAAPEVFLARFELDLKGALLRNEC